MVYILKTVDHQTVFKLFSNERNKNKSFQEHFNEIRLKCEKTQN